MASETTDESEREVIEIDIDDIVDEAEDDRRREISAELFDDDPFADEGDLDVEPDSEPSW
jgi:hypothetical protein